MFGHGSPRPDVPRRGSCPDSLGSELGRPDTPTSKPAQRPCSPSALRENLAQARQFARERVRLHRRGRHIGRRVALTLDEIDDDSRGDNSVAHRSRYVAQGHAGLFRIWRLHVDLPCSVRRALFAMTLLPHRLLSPFHADIGRPAHEASARASVSSSSETTSSVGSSVSLVTSLGTIWCQKRRFAAPATRNSAAFAQMPSISRWPRLFLAYSGYSVHRECRRFFFTRRPRFRQCPITASKRI